MEKPRKYYAVIRGRQPGIYDTWFGARGAEMQVRGFAGARYRGFPTLVEAQAWLRDPGGSPAAVKAGRQPPVAPRSDPPRPGEVIAYTDGSCLRNPGPGGYGVVLLRETGRLELARGFRLTTNNRMEMMACRAALEALAEPAAVVLHSDSSYLVQGMAKGWAKRWRANGWLRTGRQPAENADLWMVLLALCERHRVRFVWVRGHAGDPENERCDRLAAAAAAGEDLAMDEAYEQGRTTVPPAPAEGVAMPSPDR